MLRMKQFGVSKQCYFQNIKRVANAGTYSAAGSVSDWRARGLGFDTRSGHILSFLLPLIQEGQLSATGKSVCMKYWLTA